MFKHQITKSNNRNVDDMCARARQQNQQVKWYPDDMWRDWLRCVVSVAVRQFGGVPLHYSLSLDTSKLSKMNENHDETKHIQN